MATKMTKRERKPKPRQETLPEKTLRLAAAVRAEMGGLAVLGFKTVEKWIRAGQLLDELRTAVLANGDNWQRKCKPLCGWNPGHACKIIFIAKHGDKVRKWAKDQPFPVLREAYLHAKGYEAKRWDKHVPPDKRLRRKGRSNYDQPAPGEIVQPYNRSDPGPSAGAVLGNDKGVVVSPVGQPEADQPTQWLTKIDGLAALDIATVADQEGVYANPDRVRRIVHRLFALVAGIALEPPPLTEGTAAD